MDPSEARVATTRPLLHGLNPYTVEGEKYYNGRISIRAADKFRKAVYKKYNFLCPGCGESLAGEEEIELHHIKAKADGGKYTLKNIQPLHRTCHHKITHESAGKP